jgi:hypothetical protein
MTAIEQLSHAETTPAETGPQHGALGTMALGALGVVYGDIGTSPLYTFKTAIEWAGGEATPAVALGILSLVVWTLIITTSIKYVAIVMRADNDGEGGILALMSLLGIKHGERAFVISLGIIGAAMLYGDGAITPAISVLSALEGIKDPLPSFAPYVLPLSVVVLLALLRCNPRARRALARCSDRSWRSGSSRSACWELPASQSIRACSPRSTRASASPTSSAMALPAFSSSAACSCAPRVPKPFTRTWAISARRRYG